MTTIDSLRQLSDQQLLERVHSLADTERRATVALIATLAEFDARKLYLREGCSSLFTYCTHVLHLSEHAAYGRIEAARAVRRFPVVLDLLSNGSLTLTTTCLLAPHLTEENHSDLLAAAQHRSKREVELLVAALRPQPAVPSSVRKMPIRAAVQSPPAPQASRELFDAEEQTPRVVRLAVKPTAAVTPLAPELYKLRITLSADGHDQLRRAQDLLRHSIPNGDPATIVERALALLVRQLEQTKFAATDRPCKVRPGDPRSRHIPAAVRRAHNALRGRAVGWDTLCARGQSGFRRTRSWTESELGRDDGPKTSRLWRNRARRNPRNP